MRPSIGIFLAVVNVSFVDVLITELSGAPTSSSDDESSPKNTDSYKPGTPSYLSEPAAAAAGVSSNAQQSTSGAATQMLTEEEKTARQVIAKTSDDESLQIEALFCAMTQKQDVIEQKIDERSALFSQQLFFMHLPIATTIQAEEVQTRVDLESMFKDDKVIAESTTSTSQFFQPAAKKGWGEWVTTELLRRF